MWLVAFTGGHNAVTRESLRCRPTKDPIASKLANRERQRRYP